MKKHFGAEKVFNIPPRILEILERYHWSGNVRELENEIIKWISLKKEENGNEMKSLSDKFLSDDDDPPETSKTLNVHIKHIEKNLIIKALDENGWVKSKAAKTLGIPESTLKYKIKRYRISRQFLVD